MTEVRLPSLRHQFVVNLIFAGINAADADAHRIAEAVSALAVLADEEHALLVEYVIVVRELGNVYEPVSAGTLLSHKDAKVSHAGNNPVTLHADVLREILNLLGLERVTFGLRGKDLTLGSMQGRPVAVLQEFGRHTAPFGIPGEGGLHKRFRLGAVGEVKGRVCLKASPKCPIFFIE